MNVSGQNNILIIDDDQGVTKTVARSLAKLGLEPDTAASLAQGMEKIDSGEFDLILLDVNLPDGNGIDHIPAILQREFPPLIIIMTAFSDPDGAQLAIESGAWDYLQKPVSPKDLRLQVFRALEFQNQKRQSRTCMALDAPDIIGESPVIQRCLTQAAQIVCSDGNVLITGETGTGKELFARAIHQNSARRNGDFIVVDCSVLSENLIESVLFGHRKGAFTGADRDRKGLVALANGGTLFLDEVGELPESMQSSFLRVLQERAFRPVGSEQEAFSDFRVICATNRDLDRMAAKGRFRLDLLYRLKTFVLNLPPLRSRADDIWAISKEQMTKVCQDLQVPEKEISPDFMETLMGYDWPGNVRELINTIEWSITSALNEPTLYAFHLPAGMRAKLVRSRIDRFTPCVQQGGRPGTPADAPSYQDAMDKAEKDYLATVHTAENGNIQQMLVRTKLSRTVLYRKLKKYDIR